MPPKKRKDDSDSDGEKKKRVKKDKTAKVDPESDEETSDVVLPAPTVSGTLLISGATNWDMTGRKQLPKGVKNVGGPNLWGPHVIEAMKDTPVRSVISGCCAVHSVVIDSEGNPYSWGRNDKAQLGQGDTDRRDVPVIVDSLSGLKIVSAACGRNHTLFLSERGSVYAVGDNKMGQLGLGHQGSAIPSPTRIQYKGPPISHVACGGEFSMISDIRGNLYSFGCPEYGQLGHNTDGKYFVSGNKLSYSCELKPRKVSVFIEKGRDGHITPVIDVEVEGIACGTNHTVMMDRKKRVYTWGFGGYGRLGHTDPKDEFVPRLIKTFEGNNRGAVKIAAGSSYSLAVNELGALYLWGKSKPTGEAAMYPKAVHDLSGWQVRSIGCCNMSIVLAADESVVSWGYSPTYGELAYGENKPKSSSTPQESKPLEGIYIQEVAGGVGHSLFIARTDSEEEKKKLETLPLFRPQPPPN